MPDASNGSALEKLPRYGRSLFDKILYAFHHACDLEDLEAANALLNVLENFMSSTVRRPGDERQRHQQSLVAAHQRLWQIRNRETG
jgi:hypothetical protein